MADRLVLVVFSASLPIVPRSRRLPFVLCHLAALAAVVSGCSTSEAPSQAREVSSSADATPVSRAPSSEAARATSTTAATPTPKLLSARELLLATSQLGGGGWKPGADVDPEATEPQPATQPECSNQSWTLRTTSMIDAAGAAWHFDQAAETESITSQVFVYQDDQAATTALAAYRDVVSRCTSWRDGPSGYNFQETQEAFDVALGTESVARSQTAALISAPDIAPYTVYWVSSRVGSAIVQVTFQGGILLGNGGKGRAIDLATAAVANVTR